MLFRKEKRLQTRYPENLTVLIDDPVATKPRFSGNISSGGVFIYTFNTWSPGTNISFRIFPSGAEDGPPISIKGVVAFAVDQAESEKKGFGPGVGVKCVDFKEADDEDRYHQLLAAVTPAK